MQNNKKLMGEMDRTRVCQVLRQLFSEAETCRLWMVPSFENDLRSPGDLDNLTGQRSPHKFLW